MNNNLVINLIILLQDKAKEKILLGKAHFKALPAPPIQENSRSHDSPGYDSRTHSLACMLAPQQSSEMPGTAKTIEK